MGLRERAIRSIGILGEVFEYHESRTTVPFYCSGPPLTTWLRLTSWQWCGPSVTCAALSLEKLLGLSLFMAPTCLAIDCLRVIWLRPQFHQIHLSFNLLNCYSDKWPFSLSGPILPMPGKLLQAFAVAVAEESQRSLLW